MNRSRHEPKRYVRATGSKALAAILLLPLLLSPGNAPRTHAAKPEYLAAELPIPSTLRDTRSATDNVGLPLEDRELSELLRPSASCDLTPLGLKGISANTSCLWGNTPDTGAAASPDQREFNVTLDYKPLSKSHRNLWIRLRYARNDRDNNLDRTDLRAILNYSFTF